MLYVHNIYVSEVQEPKWEWESGEQNDITHTQVETNNKQQEWNNVEIYIKPFK